MIIVTVPQKVLSKKEIIQHILVLIKKVETYS